MRRESAAPHTGFVVLQFMKNRWTFKAPYLNGKHYRGVKHKFKTSYDFLLRGISIKLYIRPFIHMHICRWIYVNVLYCRVWFSFLLLESHKNLLGITELTVCIFPWNVPFNETYIFTRQFKAVHRNRIHQSLENYILET